jgi:hypothetical protein
MKIENIIVISKRKIDLARLCRSILKLSDDIIFVGIVDQGSRLLVGECNNYLIPMGSCKCCQNSILHAFYLYCLVDLVRETGCDACCSRNCTEVHFTVSLYNRTRLIAAQLTQNKDTYFCIHMHETSLEHEVNIINTVVESVF